MALALADSSALIAYLAADDTLHPSAVAAIETAMRDGMTLAISAVTWSETLHGALLGHYPETALREFVTDFGIEILPIDADVAEQAAALQKAYRGTSRTQPRPRLRTPDALILGTSVARVDVVTVIGGDAKWPNVPGVEVPIVLLTATG